MAAAPVVLVTGFEPFGPYKSNPSEEVARGLDGLAVGAARVRSAVLPVDHVTAVAAAVTLIDELQPRAIVHFGLAAGRARIALERVALNVLDFEMPDRGGHQPRGEPCVRGGPAAYFATLPLDAILAALTADGIPAYCSNTAGTYLCNQTLYATLHALAGRRPAIPAGFVHLPLSPALVAESGLEQPSLGPELARRAGETILRVVVEHDEAGPGRVGDR